MVSGRVVTLLCLLAPPTTAALGMSPVASSPRLLSKVVRIPVVLENKSLFLVAEEGSSPRDAAAGFLRDHDAFSGERQRVCTSWNPQTGRACTTCRCNIRSAFRPFVCRRSVRHARAVHCPACLVSFAS
eukprot:4737946-Prymnesium_polylepis.1